MNGLLYMDMIGIMPAAQIRQLDCIFLIMGYRRFVNEKIRQEE